jgi:hypothetical protein
VITLTLTPRSSPPSRSRAPQPFQGTTLNVQPAPGSGAETAAPQFFERTSRTPADLEAVRAGIRNIVETTVVDLSVAHTLAGGNAVVLPIQGTAFMLDKGADVGVATLHIQDQTNTPVNSLNVFPGDAYDLPFTFVVIENAAQAGKVLRIHYGTDISFKPSLAGTLTISGNVSIAQTIFATAQNGDVAAFNGNAFGYMVVAGAQAATNSVVQIFNPNGSGKRIYVDAIAVNSPTAAIRYQTYGGAALTTLIAGTVPVKRKPGGPASIATFRSDQLGAAPADLADLVDPNTAQNSARLLFATPYELEPNNGMNVISANQQGTNFNCAFEWREY